MVDGCAEDCLGADCTQYRNVRHAYSSFATANCSIILFSSSSFIILYFKQVVVQSVGLCSQGLHGPSPLVATTRL